MIISTPAGTPSFKDLLRKVDCIELTENKKQFIIPKGFAYGFLMLSDTAEFYYKCDGFYNPCDEGEWLRIALRLEFSGHMFLESIKKQQVSKVIT